MSEAEPINPTEPEDHPQTMKLKTTTLSLAAACLAAPVLCPAQPSAHYVPGVEGIKAASLPPPGVYLRDYNVVYYSDRLNDANGDKVSALDTKALIYANVPRLLWITDQQVLGGFLGVDALLPLQYTDLDIKVNHGPTVINDGTFGIGDFFVEGTWSKHIKQFDFSLAYGIWAPTGDSSSQPVSTRAGLGYWTHMFTAGVTWYPDADKKWAISALNRYEISMDKDDAQIAPGVYADVTPGQAYTLEYAASRTVCPNVEVGVVGYYQKKTTQDSAGGALQQRDMVAAIGPEVSAFCTKLGINTSLRYLYEFAAENGLQGHTIALTLTKRF